MHKSTTTKMCTGHHLRNIASSTDCGIRATNILVAFLFPGGRISSCVQNSSHHYQKKAKQANAWHWRTIVCCIWKMRSEFWSHLQYLPWELLSSLPEFGLQEYARSSRHSKKTSRENETYITDRKRISILKLAKDVILSFPSYFLPIFFIQLTREWQGQRQFYCFTHKSHYASGIL
jgi:hypothetical protein